MRVLYHPVSADQLGGGNIPVYSGHYMRGAGIGSVLSSVWRIALPLLKGLGKAVGTQALKSAGEVAGDVLTGEKIGRSLERRSVAGVKQLVDRGTRKLSQTGQGLGRPKRKGSRFLKLINAKKSVGERGPRSNKRKRKVTDAFGSYLT